MNIFSKTDRKANVVGITEMCRIFNVSPRTLRFYESKELLSPIREGQHRLFTKSDRGRMKLIMQGKRFGFSLEEIRQLLNLYSFGDHRTRQIKETYQLGLKRLSSMEDQKRELKSAINDLKAQLGLCKDLLIKRGADRDSL
jgi:DNA-binding transcriptional MerR regulator